MVDYTAWKVNDIVNICVSVTAFCGTQTQGLIFGTSAISKDPDVCATVPGTSHCQITVDNVGITFKLVKGCNDSNTPTHIYRDLGQFYTNTNGQTGVQFTVLNSDLANYNSSGGDYQAMMVITDSKGQNIIELSKCTNQIAISPPPEKWKCIDAVTNTCVRDDSIGTYNSEAECKAALSCQPPSGATDYIEYDFSFLPTSFLGLVGDNIVGISNGLGKYLPSASNISYINSSYNSGKFRVYITYTPPSLSGSSLSGLSQFYKSPDRTSELLANPAIASLIELPVDTFARLLSGLIIFGICQQLLIEVVGWGTIISTIAGVIGAVVVDWSIHNISLDTSTPGTNGTSTPLQNVDDVNNFVINYGIPSCTTRYPGCVVVPPTCDTVTMRLYNSCMIPNDLAQCLHADATAGNTQSCDAILQNILDVDAGLANGTMTPAQAQAAMADRRAAVAAKVAQVIVQVTCEPGVTVYNPDTKTCVKIENCVIRNPFGGCILSKDTAQGLLMFGGLIIGGYLIMGSGSGHGSTEHTVTIREQISQAKENAPKQKENVSK